MKLKFLKWDAIDLKIGTNKQLNCDFSGHWRAEPGEVRIQESHPRLSLGSSDHVSYLEDEF